MTAVNDFISTRKASRCSAKFAAQGNRLQLAALTLFRPFADEKVWTVQDMAEKRVISRGLKQNAQDPLGANSEIARKLKQYYGTLVTDQVPDRFAQLLSELESAESDQGKA